MRLKGIHFELEAWRDQRGAIGMPLEHEPGQDEPPSMLQVSADEDEISFLGRSLVDHSAN